MKKLKWFVPVFMLAMVLMLQLTPILGEGVIEYYEPGSELIPTNGTMQSRG
jgi:hypothetical protein